MVAGAVAGSGTGSREAYGQHESWDLVPVRRAEEAGMLSGATRVDDLADLGGRSMAGPPCSPPGTDGWPQTTFTYTDR